MIPKIIHYCWFGRNPLPPLAIKCIESWKKYLPDYEIKEWNEDNFDVNIIPYTQEAYAAKKYAFVSDYARFWVLYRYGGVYFDTDVEVIKPMNDILAKGAFMGRESDSSGVAPGLGLACQSGMSFYKSIISFYDTLHYLNVDGSQNQTTIVEYTTTILQQYGWIDNMEIQNVDGITIYPEDYFCPISILTKKLNITSNTCTIHHYSASWMDNKKKEWIKNAVKKILNEDVILGYIRFKKWIYSFFLFK